MTKKYHGRGRALHEMREREMYAGEDSRRVMEAKDFHMITEDHNAMANLPQEVMMKYYPKPGFGLNPELDDTIRGIDRQQSDDHNDMKRHISKSKY